MTTTSRQRATRALFHFDYRDGLDKYGVPVIRSGQTATYDRGGIVNTATAADRNGRVFTPGYKSPRFHHIYSATSGLYEPAGLLLEGSRASLIKYFAQFDSWTGTNGGAGSAPVVTADQTTAPDGQTTADKVVFAAPGAGDQSFVQATIFTASAATSYTSSFWVKAYSAADVGKVLLYRHAAGFTYGTITLTAAWQQVTRTEVGYGGNTSLQIGLRPTIGGSSGTVNCYLWGGEVQLGSFASQPIPSGATLLTRSADAFSCAFNAPPMAMTVYVKGVNLGTLNSGTFSTIVRISSAADASPYFAIWNNTAGRVEAGHHNGTALAQSNCGVAASFGDTVEARAVLAADGSVIGAASYNSGAENIGAASAANTLASAWSAQTLYIGTDPADSTRVGFFTFQQVKIASGTQTLATMRTL
jgi:hypothetical protein